MFSRPLYRNGYMVMDTQYGRSGFVFIMAVNEMVIELINVLVGILLAVQLL